MNDRMAWIAQLALSQICFLLGYFWTPGFFVLGTATCLLGLMAEYIEVLESKI